jgi:DNA-binding NtrC family response regulator
MRQYHLYQIPAKNLHCISHSGQRSQRRLNNDETCLKRNGQRSDGQRSATAMPFVATLVEREKEIIESVLAECHGQVAGRSGAAAKLGMPRQTLESKIKSLGIDKHRFKARQTT